MPLVLLWLAQQLRIIQTALVAAGEVQTWVVHSTRLRLLKRMEDWIGAVGGQFQWVKGAIKGLTSQLRSLLREPFVGAHRSGVLTNLSFLVPRVVKAREQAINAHVKASRVSWELFLEKALSRGAGWAHKWTRPADPVSYQLVQTPHGPTSAPQEVLASEATKWGGISVSYTHLTLPTKRIV